MQYETLYLNDDGTAKVRMTINDNVLEQDFDIQDLDINVKQGMAIFQAELGKNQPTPVDNSIIGKVTSVKPADLPTIPPEDFQPEQPLEPLVDTTIGG